MNIWIMYTYAATCLKVNDVNEKHTYVQTMHRIHSKHYSGSKDLFTQEENEQDLSYFL